jgi:hypothetical protein
MSRFPHPMYVLCNHLGNARKCIRTLAFEPGSISCGHKVGKKLLSCFLFATHGLCNHSGNAEEFVRPFAYKSGPTGNVHITGGEHA